MYKSDDVAAYFLAHDDWDMFCGYFENTITRINTFLHLAQNLYVTKYGAYLFEPDLFAEDDGVICAGVEENYDVLFSNIFELPEHITSEDRTFLEQFIDVFRCMPTDELMMLSEEDPERLARLDNKGKALDPLSRVDEYRTLYNDYLEAMAAVDVSDRMPW